MDKWAEKQLQAGEGAPSYTPGKIYLGQGKQGVGTGPELGMNYSTEDADIYYLTLWGAFF